MPETIADMWSAGERWREPFIERARDFARLSLPQFMPRYDGEVVDGERFAPRYSGRAARGVTNLASKLTIGLFPPTGPFVKFEPDLREAVEAGLDEEQLNDAILALSRRERALEAFLDGTGWRARAFFLFQHLLISGNYLLRQTKAGRFVGYRLDQFQVQRDGLDRPRTMTIKEMVPRGALVPYLGEDVAAELEGVDSTRPDHVYVFTRCEVVQDNLDDEDDKRVWRVWQEVGSTGIALAEPRELTQANLPYIPIRLFQSDEDYGRSLFDMLQGEIELVEGLTQAVAEDAVMAANGVWRIDPASGVTANEFLDKSAGEVVYAKDGQIGMVRADKGGDLAVAVNVLDRVDRELAAIFLSFLPRDAERVTAQEIQRVTQELNEAFGGAFSLLAQELQLPVARLTESRMEALGLLPKLRSGIQIRRKIVTGMDAIGRGRDELAIESFIASLQAAIGPEATARRLKIGGLAKRFAADKGLDPETLVYSDEEFDQREGARMEAEAVSQNLGPIVKAASDSTSEEA